MSRTFVYSTYFFILLIIMLTVCAKVSANDDVTWIPSSEKGIHILLIEIDGCETTFKIKDKDLYSFANQNKAINEAFELASKRAEKGCRD